MKLITCQFYYSFKSILMLLESFKKWNYSSPYQNIEYFKISLNNFFIYSVIRMSWPCFIKFNIDGEDSLIIPLSKSLFSSNYKMYGDGAGFGYLDFLHDHKIQKKDILLCLKYLINLKPDKNFHFNKVKNNTIVYETLKELAVLIEQEDCVKVCLPQNFEEYFNSLSKNVRQNYRTANNRILKSNKILSISHIKGKHITNTTFKQILSLYIKRLKFYKKRNIFFDKIFYKFFDIGFKAIRKLDFVDVFAIYIDGEMAAFMMCMKNDDELYVPKLAINEEYSFYSPGLLLSILSIENLLKKNLVDSIDFIQGKEEYKFQVGGKIHQCSSFVLNRTIEKY